MGLKDISLWNEGDWIAVVALVLLTGFLVAGAMIAGSKKPEFAGHPKGLYMLFFAEMWERFSFYGMRALLIFYLVQHWAFADDKSNLIYGSYLSLVYITPVLGGYLADRYLGSARRWCSAACCWRSATASWRLKASAGRTIRRSTSSGWRSR
jgi:POT family proton-dependent oligopeptide transporter